MGTWARAELEELALSAEGPVVNTPTVAATPLLLEHKNSLKYVNILKFEFHVSLSFFSTIYLKM